MHVTHHQVPGAQHLYMQAPSTHTRYKIYFFCTNTMNTTTILIESCTKFYCDMVKRQWKIVSISSNSYFLTNSWPNNHDKSHMCF